MWSIRRKWRASCSSWFFVVISLISCLKVFESVLQLIICFLANSIASSRSLFFSWSCFSFFYDLIRSDLSCSISFNCSKVETSAFENSGWEWSCHLGGWTAFDWGRSRAWFWNRADFSDLIFLSQAISKSSLKSSSTLIFSQRSFFSSSTAS